MQTADRTLLALQAAKQGMLRSLGVLEAISHLNEEAGLVALIDAGKDVLGRALEDSGNAIDAITSGDEK